MAIDFLPICLDAFNLELVRDVKISLLLVCLVPMLETVNVLMKNFQLHATFVCDFVATTKICQNDLHIIYVDLVMAFTNDLFWRFHRLAKIIMNICACEVDHELEHGDWPLGLWIYLTIINTFGQHIKNNWKLMVIILLHGRFILLSYMKSNNKRWLLLLNWLVNCILVFPMKNFWMH